MDLWTESVIYGLGEKKSTENEMILMKCTQAFVMRHGGSHAILKVPNEEGKCNNQMLLRNRTEIMNSSCYIHVTYRSNKSKLICDKTI